MPTVLIFVNLKLTNHLARQNEVYPKLWLKILPLHSFCYCLTLHVTWLHEKQLFLCQEQCMSFYCKEKKYDSVIFIDIWQPSDKPFGQMEQMRGKLASVNGDGMPLNLNEVWSLPGILLFHCLLLFAAIGDVAIWFSIWLSSQSDMQTCHQYTFQQDIHTCFPLTGGCASPSCFWSPSHRPTGLSYLWGFLLKRRHGGRFKWHRWQRQDGTSLGAKLF